MCAPKISMKTMWDRYDKYIISGVKHVCDLTALAKKNFRRNSFQKIDAYP